MATTNNSKSFFDLSVTTQLFYLIGFLWTVQLLLIFNPLTLFVLNIFKPRWARNVAHWNELYDKKSQEFFTRQAKKWPWHWAKWWYTSKEIGCLTDDKQLDYYYNVSHSGDTLNAMSIHNSAKVIGKDFEEFKGYIATINTLNAMSIAISAKDAYINMSYNLFCAFIRASIEKDDMSALGDYLKRGTLPKDQVVILSEYAGSSVPSFYRNTRSAFYDYVERCGLGKDLIKKILGAQTSAQFKEEVEKRQKIYEQRVFTKSQRGTKQTDAWLAFCETTKDICPQAQMEMGLDQYHVFHKTGHTLDAEAILHTLKHNSDRTMAQLIFEYEPNYGIVSDDIKEFLDKNLVLRSLRDSVIVDHPDDLQRRMFGNEKLTEEELSKVFDYPNAGKLIFNYITYRPIPENLHKRMLELPERADACILMYYHNEVSPQEWCLGKFHLADDVRREAERRGWIPEKKD